MSKKIIDVAVAAAVAVLGYDLMKDVDGRQDNSSRLLQGIGLCGSAAGGDTGVDVILNSVPVASLLNTATGLPTRDHIKPVNIPVPSNTEIVVKVTDAPITNPINLTLIFA